VEDTQVIAAILDSREAYDALSGRLDRKDFTEYGQVVLSEAMAYYRADGSARQVARGVLKPALGRRFPTKEQASAAMDYLDSVPKCKSPGNAVRLYKDLRRYNLGLLLVDKYISGEHGTETRRLEAKLRELEDEDTQDWKPLLGLDDIFGENRKPKIKFYPMRANAVLGGGMRPGQTMLIFGRPGSGKTALAVNATAGSLFKGHRVLYAGNEESQESIQARFVSRMGAVTLADLGADGDRGKEAWAAGLRRAKKRGLDNLHIVHGNRSLDSLESFVRKVRPAILVVDQLQHVDGSADNRTRAMENTMRRLRDMAHEYQMVVIAVTQAGPSAEYQPVLRLTDVDYSNTGTQGACEVMVGIGFDFDMSKTGKRVLTFCRNKVSGREECIPVWLDKQHSAIRNKPLGG
jgi:KaiC/GvpD/RAD55 family RecA-like ATPase